MARMIPDFLDGTEPPGERAVFNMLSGGSPDWTVIHSLDLAPWDQGRRMELDFLVIIPDAGLLCIEVKSHKEIYFDGQKWSPPAIKKSPFKQAADARYNLHRKLKDIAPSTGAIPKAHCCIFTHARFPVRPNLSVHQEELMDAEAFRSFSEADGLCFELRRRMLALAAADNAPKLDGTIPPVRVDEIVEKCFPVRKRLPGKAEEIRWKQEALEQLLRDQQKPILRLAKDNDRILVRGGAGTGKTLVALELAMQQAQAGRRVAFVCYNRLVGQWLEKEVRRRDPPPGLQVGTVHSLLRKIADVAIPARPRKEFWEETLPSRVAEKLTSPDFAYEAEFDLIVVDEAQDILARPMLWQCLVSLLEGGLQDGRFALFGDFERQVLRAPEELDMSLESVLEVATARYRLDENCRNTSWVGRTALALSGMSKETYSGFMRGDGHQKDVRLIPHEDENAAKESVREVLAEIKDAGFKPSDIVFLSFTSREKSLASRLSGIQFHSAESPSANKMLFESVRRFKGLERKIVIVTDTSTGGDFDRSLFYTAMTRATERVVVLCRAQDKETLSNWVLGAA